MLGATLLTLLALCCDLPLLVRADTPEQLAHKRETVTWGFFAWVAALSLWFPLVMSKAGKGGGNARVNRALVIGGALMFLALHALTSLAAYAKAH